MTENLPFNLASWLACLFFLIALINAGMKLVDRMRGKPTGAEVKTEVQAMFATKTEVGTVKEDLTRHINVVGKRVDDLDDDLQEHKENIVSNGEVRKKSIEGKVEGVRTELKKDIENVSKDVAATNKELGQVQGELKQINLTMMNVNSSLQQLHVQQAKHHGKE